MFSDDDDKNEGIWYIFDFQLGERWAFDWGGRFLSRIL